MRSLLPTELMKEIGGRLALTDVDPSGNRFVKFWIDEVRTVPVGEPEGPLGREPAMTRNSQLQATVPPFPFLPGRNCE